MQEQGKILIVEDDQDARTMLEFALSHVGYQVFVAPTGSSALLQFDAIRPDVVLLDIMMPGIDGWETLRHIRESSHAAVIVLTGLDDRSVKARCREYGAYACLIKPVNLRQLYATVQACLPGDTPDTRAGEQRPPVEGGD